MTYHFSTRDGFGNEVECGMLPRKRFSSQKAAFHYCQRMFGQCVGSLEEPTDDAGRTWLFVHCLKAQRGAVCLMRVTSVWWER